MISWLADMEITENEGNFRVPKAVVGFRDIGIGPNQGNSGSCKQ
jgi:hypothetical protein